MQIRNQSTPLLRCSWVGAETVHHEAIGSPYDLITDLRSDCPL